MATATFSGFSIKPVKKVRSKPTSNKVIKRTLFCKPKLEDGVWLAYINTKGIEGYKNITILPFSKESLILSGRAEIFSINKDKTNHYIHITRRPGDYSFNDFDKYTTLNENSIFKGNIIKTEEGLCFNMTDYIGHVKDYEHLLSKSYSKENNEC